MAYPFQMIYVTQHVTFQMYMCKILIEELSSCKTLEEKLIYDEDYQDLTKLRLKSLIKRHSDFIRWRDNTLLIIKNLMIPFILAAIGITTSIALSLLQDVISWRSYLLLVCVVLTITSLISAGHHLEDESEKMLMSFSIPKWYTWNIKNRKLLLTILTNTTRPISLKFTNGLIVNNTLFVFIGKTLYSIVSFFWSTKNGKH
ncbi:hypothetical protein MTP99_004025 [Tenebrio molitor]|nr:hypothetical protein MTP99_004025 [Tenebrio molitor]